MRKVARWSAATLVTMAAFAVGTWLCGAVILDHLLKDPAVRWGIASGLGVAVAALAALWGHSFAEGREAEETVSGSSSKVPAGVITGRGSTLNKISGGIFHGPVTQGRDTFLTGPDASAPAKPRQPDQ